MLILPLRIVMTRSLTPQKSRRAAAWSLASRSFDCNSIGEDTTPIAARRKTARLVICMMRGLDWISEGGLIE